MSRSKRHVRSLRLLETPKGVNYTSSNWSTRRSSASWCLMYSRITCSSRPTVDAKYPLAQKCCPTKFLFRPMYVRAMWIALFPLIKPTSCETAYFGGIDIIQVTGMDQTNANRLYREIHRRPSPAGQAPFTDTWYLRSEYRMLHAALVWKLYQRFGQSEDRPARRLIEVYETYLFLVQEPQLDITHVAFVPDLIRSKLWIERDCTACRTPFPVPRDSNRVLCPGCRLTQSFRCSACGAARSGYRKGRRKTACPVCGWRHLL